ncbi:GNAT family N-acetyltransferase [Nakamurella aerolata]|uniref:GNAT family N-acetyltransferase n=1 Tax=Nakamurella aerolata TaxID=1656892 RepID=A0A849A6V0_9ACTN|nr:GNAT family N-acetyltransferase [Nakamurella aerolata]NNG34230.1 GNAT family N-acetyltransferase [Nakamurella aerolata]
MDSVSTPATATAADLDRLTERPLTVDDAAQITELLSEVEAAEPVEEHIDEGQVRRELTGPAADLERGSVGLFDGDRLVGFIAVTGIGDGEKWKAYLHGGVRPGWTRLGLGTRLVNTARELAAAWKERDAPDREGELQMWADTKQTGAIALAESTGFDVWRHFYTMRRDLTENAAPIETTDVASGFTVRPYAEADGEPVRLARNNSFADHWGSVPTPPERWEAFMVGSPDFRPQHSLVAEFDQGDPAVAELGTRIAAFVMAEEFDAQTKAEGFRTGYIALVGTTRPARGKGLASALLGRQLLSMQRDGYARAELGVDSDSPTGAGRIYQRAGFIEARASRSYGQAL